MINLLRFLFDSLWHERDLLAYDEKVWIMVTFVIIYRWPHGTLKLQLARTAPIGGDALVFFSISVTNQTDCEVTEQRNMSTMNEL